MGVPIRLPLNSRRLTVNHLRRLASELEVPTSTSADELCQMIDSKLKEGSKEVQNVQVVLISAQPTSEFSLKDKDGKFFTVPAAEPEFHPPPPRILHHQNQEKVRVGMRC